MKAFMTQLKIQLAMDIRDRGTLLTFYIIPLIFYAVMGAVFSSIQPAAKQTLAASMAIFAVTMGAVLGMPGPLVKMWESGVLRAYKVSGIPGWSVLLSKSVSAFINLFIVAIIILFTAPVFFGASMPANMGGYIITLLLTICASIALGILIGVAAKNQAAATILSQTVFLPSLLLGGLMFPASLLPAPLQWLGEIFPATHAMQSFSGWAYGMQTATAPALALAIIAGIGIVAVFIGLIRFKRISRMA